MHPLRQSGAPCTCSPAEERQRKCFSVCADAVDDLPSCASEQRAAAREAVAAGAGADVVVVVGAYCFERDNGWKGVNTVVGGGADGAGRFDTPGHTVGSIALGDFGTEQVDGQGSKGANSGRHKSAGRDLTRRQAGAHKDCTRVVETGQGLGTEGMDCFRNGQSA